MKYKPPHRVFINFLPAGRSPRLCGAFSCCGCVSSCSVSQSSCHTACTRSVTMSVLESIMRWQEENSTDQSCIFLNNHPISILPQHTWNRRSYQVENKLILLCLHFSVKIIFFIFGYFLPLILIVILYSVMIFKLLKQVGRLDMLDISKYYWQIHWFYMFYLPKWTK